MLCRVVKHSCTNTELTVLSHENIMVGTSFATFPESLIIGQFVEGYRHITQFGIHLHHRTTAGQAEQLCLRPTQTMRMTVFNEECRTKNEELIK